MHHPDYSKPFEVAFLCARCHKAEHLGRLKQPFVVWDLELMAQFKEGKNG